MTSVFSLRHKRLCSASKPEDIGVAGGDPKPPSMSPLRAVVSRGHIAREFADRRFLLGEPSKDLAFAASALPRRPGAAARKAPRLSSGMGYAIRWRCRPDSLRQGHIAFRNPDYLSLTAHSRPGSADCRLRIIFARAAKDFVFFAPSQTAVRRCKTRRLWFCRWRSIPPLDVAAASRGFSRPHRFLGLLCLAHSRHTPVGLRELMFYCADRCDSEC